MRVAHLAFDLGAGHERGHRVDDDHVERAGADEHVGDLERLLTGVGLGDVEVVDVHADGRGVHRVHRVLGVDVGADTTVALRFGDHVHGERGLPRRLGTEHLDDPAAGRPPMPRAMSSASAPVGMAAMPTWPCSPSRMIAPLP